MLAWMLFNVACLDLAPPVHGWPYEPYGEPACHAVTPAGVRQECLVEWSWPDGRRASEWYQNHGRDGIRPGQPVRIERRWQWALPSRVICKGLEEA